MSMRDHEPHALEAAKRLRGEMSLPEVLLWRILRTRPMGVKFRRQHPVGRYVADFYCASRKLIVEIDGIAHDMGDRPERDVRRDEWLRMSGMDVVRIAASEVLKDPAEVAASLVALCVAAPPPSGATRLPPPPMGEDI
jgi:very-short-patch-repair endonuclease